MLEITIFATPLRLVILVVAICINLVLSGLVFFNHPRSATNRIFALLGVVLSFWLVAMQLSLEPRGEFVTLLWIRLSVFFAVQIVLQFYLFSHTLPSEKILMSKTKLVLLVTISIVIMIVTISPYTFTSVDLSGPIPNTTPGPGMLLFAPYVMIGTLSLSYLFYKRLRHSHGKQRQQLWLVAAGMLLMLGFVILTIIIPVAVFQNNAFVPFFSVYSLFFTGLASYAIIQHKLFDVKVFAAQALTAILIIILFAKLFVVADFSERMVDLFVLVAVAVFGYLLVKSVRREVEQREKLQELTVKLRELDKLKNEFISIAAHELRAPLSVIKGYVSMILGGDAGEISAQAKDFLQDSLLSSERMIRLVNNMLDVSRIEEGRIEYQEGEVNLTEILKQVYSEFRLEAERKKLEFKLEIAEGVVDRVYVDKDRLHEVVVNFLSNAFKYTEKGAVVLKLGNPRADYVKVEVIDSGMGISEEEQRKLFRKFYRVKSTRGKTMGSGLGLYISKLLMEKFGGKIGVSSELGKGSNFWFELPVRTKFDEEDAKT